MKIDLFTLLAQIINFFLFIFLLYFFLFKKILKVLDERKKIIESKVESANAMQRKAEDTEKKYLQKEKDLESAKEAIFQRAQTEAKLEKEKYWDLAKSEIEQQRAQWEEDLSNQKKEFLEFLQREIVKKFVNLSNRAISDLAGESLEYAIVEHLLEKLKKEKLEIQSKAVTIESSWILSDKLKQKISEDLIILNGMETSIKYKVNQELALGLNLQIDGLSIKWNIKDYLDVFQNDISDLLKNKVRL